MLYSPDSQLGVIWRIDPNSGRVEEAIRDPALLARPFISLAPGANGLHFRGRDMIVTVSYRTTVLSYAMDDKGHFGSAKIIASGIPGDDFAIGQDGSLFITTHPYNTIVRVFPGEERTIIGKAAQHIVGATDAVFGKTARDHTTLYVVTDGGAFTGGPKDAW
jgi:sugar lactone lactonase YvrE